MSRLKTLPEAVDYSGFSERFIRSLVFRKEIPHYKRGGRLYFSTEDLDDYIEGGRVEAKRDSYLVAVTPLARRQKAAKRAARDVGG